jgi:DNA-binding winged helix-turn-helix (wHTH) protein
MERIVHKIELVQFSDPKGHSLTLEGDKGRTRLGPRVSGVIQMLVESAEESPEKVVSRDEILNRVWEDPEVDENNIEQTISSARVALGDPGGNKYIETVVGEGYRFVGRVKRVALSQQIDGDVQSRALTPKTDEVQAPAAKIDETKDARIDEPVKQGENTIEGGPKGTLSMLMTAAAMVLTMATVSRIRFMARIW